MSPLHESTIWDRYADSRPRHRQQWYAFNASNSELNCDSHNGYLEVHGPQQESRIDSKRGGVECLLYVWVEVLSQPWWTFMHSEYTHIEPPYI